MKTREEPPKTNNKDLLPDSVYAGETANRKPFRYSNIFILAVVGVVIWWSADSTNVSLEPFFDPRNARQATKFITELFPPDLSESFLLLVWQLTVETFQISIIGTVLAVVIGFPLSLLAMRKRGEEFSREAQGTWRWAIRVSLYWFARTLLNISRAVPELIWALIAIIFVGLGAFAGVLALTIHSAGILGKLYAELFEAVDQRLIESTRSTGASEAQVLFFARVPVTLPVLLSYTMFRWECNMRAATVLGFVAAGGLGSQLRISMNTYNYAQVTTLVIALLILVTLVDIAGQFIRKRILDVPETSSCRPEPAEVLAKMEKDRK
jgi:phosphonate transport system permease protein